MIRRLCALAIFVLFALSAAPAQAQERAPRASLPDIEDEVMCLECNTALNVSTAAVADQQREYIGELIDKGMSKQEILAALEREYGPRVLAIPHERGFDVVAWIVPGLAVVLALALIAILARRWRRRDRSQATTSTDEPADGAEAVNAAITSQIKHLPAQLRGSLTWDQGSELARHAELKIAASIDVYFCDPHSPWQRPTLNERPRKTLNWRTPAEIYQQLLSSPEQPGVATTPGSRHDNLGHPRGQCSSRSRNAVRNCAA